MKPMTQHQMAAVRGGDCRGLRSVFIIAALTGQEEIAAAALIVAIAEGCQVV